ncbi:hypothetical protein GGX14DRAFT_397032 [Mycena pura]|uniref:Uncharacterized protein n=1 Tax=Mycena pura TaxID=153505 RepID=A0AAD6V9N6_9AGAR|nr:hypothetical protein GGX14DRAFT_397032 [Mycena pura]
MQYKGHSYLMPNPGGKNGHGEKNPPPDDDLYAAFLKYARQNMTQEQELVALRKDFGYHIGLTSLKKLRKRLEIPSSVRTQKLEVETVTQAVIEEVEKDPAHSHGPAFIKDQLRLKMLFAPRCVLSILHGQLLRDPGFRDLIRKIMVEQYPDGFDVRFPGRKKPSCYSRASARERRHGHYFCASHDVVML